jgi:hypothetical protein
MRIDLSRLASSIAILTLLLAAADSSPAQVRLKAATLVGAGGFSGSGSARVGVTVGQSLTGLASDARNATGTGFWYATLESITVTSSSIERIGDEIPEEFELHQNYPNPFNPTTRIKYGIPVSSTVRITVYNILGQLVTTIVDAKQAAGYYEVNWDSKTDNGAGLPSGVYFYRVETKDFSATRSMVFQK